MPSTKSKSISSSAVKCGKPSRTCLTCFIAALASFQNFIFAIDPARVCNDFPMTSYSGCPSAVTKLTPSSRAFFRIRAHNAQTSSPSAGVHSHRRNACLLAKLVKKKPLHLPSSGRARTAVSQSVTDMRQRAAFAGPTPGVSAILRVPGGTRRHSLFIIENRSRDFANASTSAFVATRVFPFVEAISGPTTIWN